MSAMSAMRKLVTTGCLVLLLLAAGCSSRQQRIRVELNEYGIEPAHMETRAGTYVTLEVVNWGREDHTLAIIGIEEAATYRLSPLQYEVVSFRAPAKAGQFRVICTIPGHAEQGQEALFVVTR